MAKRGEQRRWRVAFTWENGVSGTQTARTEEDARRLELELQRNAANRGMTVEVNVSERAATT